MKTSILARMAPLTLLLSLSSAQASDCGEEFFLALHADASAARIEKEKASAEAERFRLIRQASQLSLAEKKEGLGLPARQMMKRFELLVVEARRVEALQHAEASLERAILTCGSAVAIHKSK